jgi:DNA-binding CsgD family transcriptional regulator
MAIGTADHFVGRVPELALLRGRLVEACNDAFRLVVVGGDSGAGKTALLRRFRLDVGAGKVVAATGDEDEVGLAFGVLDQLYEQLPRDFDERHVRSGYGDGGLPRDATTEGVYLLDLLTRASCRAPLVVFVDDAHLADMSSLSALTFALRRLRRQQILVVLTVRAEQSSRFNPGLQRLIDVQGFLVSLGGLSTSEVRELAVCVTGGPVTSRAAERLRIHTGGNPLHLRTLLAELTAPAINDLFAPLPAPKSLGLLVLAALREHDQDTRRLATAAATLGVKSRLSDAALLAGLDAPLAAVEGLHGAGLATLSVDIRGSVLTFVHPTFRAAIYEDMSPAVRSRLHSRAAELTTGAEALKHRVSAVVAPDAELVDQLKRSAAAAEASGGWHQAANFLMSAARLSERDAARDELIVEVVGLLLRDGDLSAAAPYVHALEAMVSTPRLLHVKAQWAWRQGHHSDAETFAKAAWVGADGLDARSRDLIAAMLAQMCIMRGDGTGAADWAAEALTSGLLHWDVAAATHATSAVGLAMTGRGVMAGEFLERVVALSDSTPHPSLLAARGMLRLWSDDLPGAVVDLTAGRGPTGDGSEPHEVVALGYLVDAEYRRGNWAQASGLADQLVNVVDDTGQLWLQSFAHSMAALVPSARGEWAVAEEHVGFAQQAAAVLGDQPSLASAANAAVHLAACRADYPSVIAAAQWLLHEPGAHHEPGFFSWPVEHAAALVQLGRLGEAAARLDEIGAVARDRQRGSVLAATARVRGELEAARRNAGGARAAFDEAIELGEHTADALEAARAQAAYGRFLRRRGERRSAAIRLSQAHAHFTTLGADPFLPDCEAELRICDVGKRSSEVLGLVDLTPQEAVVAQLVSAGQTNRQVAEQLVLSIKTVDYHLGHVYQKLGVRTRMQLAAHLENR